MAANTYKVVKRSGEVVPFEIEKIKNVIKWASTGLPVNPEQLEANLQMTYKAQMTSTEIHNTVIDAAKKMTTMEEPEWTQIAARLKILAMYKEASHSRDYNSFGYDSYIRFLNHAIKEGLYHDKIKQIYTLEELKIAGKFIKPEYDLLFDFAGINALDTKYLIKTSEKSKEPGLVFELPQEAFLTISLYIEQNQPADIRLDKVKDTYTKLAMRKLSLATPILLNLRRPNGNLSSCFITAMDDDLKSIDYVEDQAARISQNAGGVGISISRVRCKNASIQGVKNASGGIVPWIRKINDTAVAVNQLGKRPGAMTVALDIWHKDIESLLELQTENGDQRLKAFDIFPQVVISDEFMRRVEDNQYWYTFDPSEVRRKFNKELAEMWGDDFTKFYKKLCDNVENVLEESGIAHKTAVGMEFEQKYAKALKKVESKNKTIELVGKIKAKDLFKHIMKTFIETGMPYISFKDTMNKYNPNKDSGVILCGNLCMESFSNTSPSKVSNDVLDENGNIIRKIIPGDLHTCNLASINLAFTEDHEFDDVIMTAVRVLDNLIDFTTAPIMEGGLHNMKYRTIGLGFMGYADYCAKKQVAYSNSSQLADELFERLALYATRASVELAKERGTFLAYDKSEYKKGIVLGKDKNWFMKNSKLSKEWCDLLDLIAIHGIRNSQITAIAPNTSTSLLQGCSASVLPVFGKFYMDNGKTTVPIVPPFIKDGAWFYQENKNIDQRKVVDVISKIQKWIDTGISMELIINPNLDYVNAKYFYDLIMQAWKKECKTIYYVRSIQKGNDAQKGEEGCVSCAN